MEEGNTKIYFPYCSCFNNKNNYNAKIYGKPMYIILWNISKNSIPF